MDFTGTYHAFIVALADETGATDSLLHVHAGLAVLLMARILTRRSLATPVPFLVVCLAELANEILDRVHLGYWTFPDTAYDVVNTLFWPFVLMVGLRWRRAAQRAATPAKAD